MNNNIDNEYYAFLISKARLNDPTFNKDYFDFLINKYNYKDMIHDILKNVIAPELKKRGFKKRGKTFYRERDGLIEICNIQFSRYNDRYSASFTYNIQIAMPSLYDLLGIDYTDKLQTVIFAERLGQIILWAKGTPSTFDSDYWYRLEAIDKIIRTDEITQKLDKRYNKKTGEGFVKVIVDDIENVIIKFFESIPTAEQILIQIDNNNLNKYTDETIILRVEELLRFNLNKY